MSNHSPLPPHLPKTKMSPFKSQKNPDSSHQITNRSRHRKKNWPMDVHSRNAMEELGDIVRNVTAEIQAIQAQNDTPESPILAESVGEASPDLQRRVVEPGDHDDDIEEHRQKRQRLAKGEDPAEKETDILLPIANVFRIMKSVLPENAKIANPAKEICRESVSEFLSFVTSEAADRCIQEKRRTILGEDIIWALESLGFDNYTNLLKSFLRGYRINVRGDDPADFPESPTSHHEEQPPEMSYQQAEQEPVQEEHAAHQEDHEESLQESMENPLLALDPAILSTIQMAIAQHQQEQYEEEQRQFQQDLDDEASRQEQDENPEDEHLSQHDGQERDETEQENPDTSS